MRWNFKAKGRLWRCLTMVGQRSKEFTRDRRLLVIDVEVSMLLFVLPCFRNQNW
jgi:hypothetical protein